MKIKLSLLGAVLLSACSTIQELPSTSDQNSDLIANTLTLLDQETSNHVMVIAHRACWSEGAPENSLAAIQECIDLGVDMIEIDVMVTADGVPVLLHDLTVDRTTNGSGAIADLTYEEITGLRLKSAAGGSKAATTDQVIPTLKDALTLAKGQILINLDVKGEVFSEAYEVVEATGTGDQILMKMAASPTVSELVEADFLGRTLFMPIIRECSLAQVNIFCVQKLSGVVPDYSTFDPIAYEITYTHDAFLSEGLSVMRDLGARVWVNTLNPNHAAGKVDMDALSDPDGTWGHVLNLGADMIQTDYPKHLMRHLAEQGRRTPYPQKSME